MILYLMSRASLSGNGLPINQSMTEIVIDADEMLEIFPDKINTQATFFALPIVCTEQAYLSEWLTKNQIQTVATTPDTKSLHWDIDYKKPTALLFGSESDGLSDFWLRHTNERIRISMAGRADSLNVAAAAAVCLYEAKRQRSQPI